MATKKIPYGISDFQAVSLDNFYYVDKTRFIKEIEESPRLRGSSSMRCSGNIISASTQRRSIIPT